MLVLRLSAIAIVLLTISFFQAIPNHSSISSRAGFSIEETLPDFPPGATVLFSDSALKADENVEIDGVLLKRIDAQGEQTVWTVPVLRPDQSAIGFVVPQLPRGAYEASCESKNAAVKIPSVKFTIVPRLLAEDGIVRSKPGKEVEVRVRIPIPKVEKKGGGSTEINVLAGLTSRNPDIAQVMTDPQKVGGDGSAVWKVRINGGGVAEIEAAAEGFEPAVMNVVGMPGPGATFREAQLAYLKAQMRILQESTARAEERSKRLQEEIDHRQRETAARPSREKTGPEIDQLDARRVGAVAEAENYKRRSNETRAVIERYSSVQPASMNESQLKPGDVLLVLGSSPILSEKIRQFDGAQLGIPGEYSHASLYVGELNGTKMVAEMWGSGYWITPLSVSTKGARLVDVYRHNGIDDNKRGEIANRGKTIFGDPRKFVRSTSPWFWSLGSGLPYAHEEIKVLVLAALGSPVTAIQTYVVTLVDPLAGGRRKMICSELVAWVYDDVGLPLDVQYWRSLTDAGIFSSNDRRRDYTTPNMIALSKTLTRVGRYLSP